VAIRIGYVAGAAAVARRIGVSHRVLVASPAYLRRAGTSRTPADVATHALIVGPASLGAPRDGRFARTGRPSRSASSDVSPPPRSRRPRQPPLPVSGSYRWGTWAVARSSRAVRSRECFPIGRWATQT
jgi:hypothetical protein